jgi:hypothetical protein
MASVFPNTDASSKRHINYLLFLLIYPVPYLKSRFFSYTTEREFVMLRELEFPKPFASAFPNTDASIKRDKKRTSHHIYGNSFFNIMYKMYYL